MDKLEKKMEKNREKQHKALKREADVHIDQLFKLMMEKIMADRRAVWQRLRAQAKFAAELSDRVFDVDKLFEIAGRRAQELRVIPMSSLATRLASAHLVAFILAPRESELENPAPVEEVLSEEAECRPDDADEQEDGNGKGSGKGSGPSTHDAEAMDVEKKDGEAKNDDEKKDGEAKKDDENEDKTNGDK